ncbi:MAG: cobalamin-dependent protein, partial [Proteobacteria bacterium]|nr:cobalamin-dependent protein [Pseudomonadota bacterium]
MKYHFIYPDVGTGYFPDVHHGLAHLFGVLKYGGHQVSLHHVKKPPKKEEMLAMISRESPDIIGFTTMSNQVEYVKLWSRWIKDVFDIPIICGGVHATLNPEELLSMESIDAVCVGEGEQAILDNNFREPYPLIENLDELPFPDYSLFDCDRILKAKNGNFAVIVSRGCPYQCSYCCNHALMEKQKGLGKYFRCRSVGSVLSQLEQLVSEYPIRSFSFADDIFGINMEWAMEFCERYPGRIGLPFECNLRVEMVNRELLSMLRNAGCAMVEM